jgi:3-hydroxyisobutyrate dehydrogenase-like beta-hydroxyacid dehydrogenase
MSAKQHVGLIGAGLMGHGIALNILKHGHTLGFLVHPGNQPTDDLIAGGATPRRTSAEVAALADVVILCITGSPEVEDVMFRQDGLLAGLKPGTMVIDCTTANPASTRVVAARLAEKGGRYLDAGMTRTPKEAAEGRINLLVGAPDDLLQQALPMLRCFAENITHAGGVSTGHQLKLLHNFVALGFSAVLAEATVAARRAGVADELFVDVLGKGGGGGVIFERVKPYILAGDTSAFTFSLANCAKDTGYYLALTEELGASNRLAQAAKALYADAIAQGQAARPVPELIAVLAR